MLYKSIIINDPSGMAPEKEKKRDKALYNQVQNISSGIKNIDRINYKATIKHFQDLSLSHVL
jgi:hypothetical protein